MTDETLKLSDKVQTSFENLVNYHDQIVDFKDFKVVKSPENESSHFGSTKEFSAMYLESTTQDVVINIEEHHTHYILILASKHAKLIIQAGEVVLESVEVVENGFSSYYIPADTALRIRFTAQPNSVLYSVFVEDDLTEMVEPFLEEQGFDLSMGNRFLNRHHDHNVSTMLESIDTLVSKVGMDKLFYRSMMFKFYSHFILRLRYFFDHYNEKELSNLQVKVFKAAAIIESDLAAFSKVEDLCREVGISVDSLQSGFKDEFGLTINLYVKNKRLEKATELLSKTDLTISEIVYKIGLKSPSYFSETFKSVMNCTPTSYRKKYRTAATIKAGTY